MSLVAAMAAASILLIAGSGHEGPGRHEYAAGAAQIAGWLKDALPQADVRVSQGWPVDLGTASTLVLYLDGAEAHPLNDAAKRRAFEAAMRRGVGVVALHQASTGDDALQPWLGAVRPGLFDRTTEMTVLRPAGDSPLTRSLRPIEVLDEFYPTLKLAPGAMPVLSAALHPQYRDGKAVLSNEAEQRTVAWTYQRPDGGRSFGYTGAHFLSSLAPLRPVLINAIAWTAGLDVPPRADVTTFHHDAQRSGWFANETALTPSAVASSFGQLWQSPQLASFDGQDARLYASPLYLEDLQLTAGELRGQSFATVIAATSNGDVYAINARKQGDIAPGRILWRTHLADPCRLQPAPLDGVPTGILSTPVIDAARGRLYVTACETTQRWQAYALDLGSGAVQAGWPVRLDEKRLNEVNRNAGPAPVPPTRKFDFRVQRGALNLSPDGTRLYVAFGETETGWLAAVDTSEPRVDSAFAAVAMPHRGSGGIWGAGGPAVDADGAVYAVTGSGFDGYKDQPNDWTQSVLKLDRGLNLLGTYTPFNHCVTAKNDIDLGSGGVALLPGSSLLTVGGKQGNVYLLDREHLPGRLDRRPACSGDAASDASLHDGRGPLNVFGPYSEVDAALDLARARSVPATFRAPDGSLQIVASGTSKAAAGSSDSVAPSLVRLSVVAKQLKPAARAMDLVFQNPGSPIVSSRPDGSEAIAWVLDENARRSAPLNGPNAPAPVLHAVDAMTMKPLWHSAPGELAASGKYNEPIVVRGQVIVGTDRIQAFGFGGSRAAVPITPKASAAVVAADDGRPVDGAAVYQQRCAACHDAPAGSIPSKSWIASRGRERIVEALSRGAMQVQAAGLSAREIEAVAGYLHP
ncbi:ThuA domain-containing protein [Paucibacter sp. R3-3]|uniref:ThuA domain-containing protein n=1 Tax=Roseateles agri TaxID=3098619 RepID=A0ABU5DEB9_9BURK|nr:ThuA domain-containing protein [Paucibacter sp. R3-3]MDY0744151.1 ThuA domain-containing protein [Paucibacter sp. R3-3]